MPDQRRNTHRRNVFLRGLIEVAFIIFLFYSNLLMGQFDAVDGRGKTLALALHNIFTGKNFTIAFCSAIVGYLVFEYLRKQF